MSPSWLLHSGKGPSVEGVWMNKTRRLITMYDFQTHYYLIFALFSWLSLSVNKNVFIIIICLLFTNLTQLSSQNPEIQVSLYSFLFLPTIFMEHRKKMESFGPWTGHSCNIFCFHTQLKTPHYAYWDLLDDIIRDDNCAYAVFQYNIHCTGSSRITV